MIGARWAWLGMHSTIYTNECCRALTVAIADAMICLAQDRAKCNAWAGLAECTNGLHALISLPRTQAGVRRNDAELGR
jgi:hypothetical protein